MHVSVDSNPFQCSGAGEMQATAFDKAWSMRCYSISHAIVALTYMWIALSWQLYRAGRTGGAHCSQHCSTATPRKTAGGWQQKEASLSQGLAACCMVHARQSPVVVHARQAPVVVHARQAPCGAGIQQALTRFQ
jgi:hypothetical protein